MKSTEEYRNWQRLFAPREEVRLRGGPDDGRVIEVQAEPPYDSSPSPPNCSTYEYRRTNETDEEGRPVFKFVDGSNNHE